MMIAVRRQFGLPVFLENLPVFPEKTGKPYRSSSRTRRAENRLPLFREITESFWCTGSRPHLSSHGQGGNIVAACGDDG